VAIIFDTNAKLSDAKFREIGRIVAHWSLLEYMMQLAIGRIIGTNLKTARILSYRAGTDRLVERLKLVAEVHGLPKRSMDRLVRLLARIEKLKPHRNDVAHGLWGPHQKRWYLIQFRSPKYIKIGKSKLMTANELRRTAARIEKLTNAFDRWRLSLPDHR
jgi:hypothetical protein